LIDFSFRIVRTVSLICQVHPTRSRFVIKKRGSSLTVLPRHASARTQGGGPRRLMQVSQPIWKKPDSARGISEMAMPDGSRKGPTWKCAIRTGIGPSRGGARHRAADGAQEAIACAPSNQPGVGTRCRRVGLSRPPLPQRFCCFLESASHLSGSQ
jgi:hypothetical protein